MNRENIIRLRDAIDYESEARFDMVVWVEHDDCGTAACIGGFAQLLMQSNPEDYANYETVFDWLGLDRTDVRGGYSLHRRLFDGRGSKDAYLPCITKHDAVAVLDNYLAGNDFTTWYEFGHGRETPDGEPKYIAD